MDYLIIALILSVINMPIQFLVGGLLFRKSFEAMFNSCADVAFGMFFMAIILATLPRFTH